MARFLYGTTGLDANGETIYSGVTFATAIALLEHFRDTLSGVGAAWTIVLDDIDPNLILKMKGTDPDTGHECFVNFTVVELNSNTFDLTIEGDVDGTGRTSNSEATPEPVSLTQRVRANSGKLFVTATERSFNFISIEQTYDSIPYWGGIPERQDPTKTGHWGYGKIDWRMDSHYLAEYDQGYDWRHLKDYFYTAAEPVELINTSQGCYEGTLDPTVFLMAASKTNNATSSAYKPENGALGPDGKPQIRQLRLTPSQKLQGQYAHLEGEPTPKDFYLQPDFTVVGMASLAKGSQATIKYERCNATFDGKEYVRETYITGDVKTQGFCINQEISATPFA